MGGREQDSLQVNLNGIPDRGFPLDPGGLHHPPPWLRKMLNHCSITDIECDAQDAGIFRPMHATHAGLPITESITESITACAR
jgi:hypothetical protein